MKSTAQAVVIGGGIAGASIAYFLAKLGVKDVLLLEKEGLASGATGKSAALVRMHYTNPWDALLALRSWELFREWDHIGGQCGFKETGFLMVGSHEEAAKVRANVKMLKHLGVNTHALSPEDVKLLQPFMNVEDIGAAAYEPESGFADGSDTVHSLVEGAKKLGVKVKQGTSVEKLKVEGGKVKGVVLRDGEIDSPIVVLAAGAWSKALANTAGVDLPLKIRSIFAGVVQRPPSIKTHMVVIDRVTNTYFRPDTADLTLLGLRSQKPEEQESRDVESAPSEFKNDDIAFSVKKLTNRIPTMNDASLKRIWMGVDGFTPDGHCILDKAPGVAGLYLAVGFSGTGFKVGPAVGRCMAELIVHDKTATVDIKAFRLSRFKEGKPLYGAHEYGVVGEAGRGWMA